MRKAVGSDQVAQGKKKAITRTTIDQLLAPCNLCLKLVIYTDHVASILYA
jgi:hypothetical protein